MKYKVLITTSGIGSRLGELTKFTNKALIRIGRKPAISYIVELYPPRVPIVVTLGYYGAQVKDFLTLAYPSRKFTFVEVKKYRGKGSSLLYSMTRAEKYLRLPFIYHACDTFVSGKVPPPLGDWNGGVRGNGSSQYASFDVVNGRVQEIYDKGTLKSDYMHIGLVGIKHYKEFWKRAHQYLRIKGDDGAANDVVVIRRMIKDGTTFRLKTFSGWHDIGNVESLNIARKETKDKFMVLDKTDESIYLFEKFVIKFFYDQKNVINRVKRAKEFGKFVPKILGTKGNFYKYKYVSGSLLSEIYNLDEFRKFLEWSQKNLWTEMRTISDKKFKNVCKDFYYNKTINRVDKFLESRSIKDSAQIINGIKVPPIKEIFEVIDWDYLTTAKQTRFHGDYILDNILKTKTGYCLLDWRQDFGGLLKAGDMYYDLGKLNHNLMVNHDLMNRNLFTIKISKGRVDCDILRKNNLVECEKILWKFVDKNKLDSRKIKLITPIIWLNMSPLHSHPLDLFLFHFGKYNLWRAINEKN